MITALSVPVLACAVATAAKPPAGWGFSTSQATMYRAAVSRTVDIHATLPSALQRMRIAAPLPAAPPKSHPPSEVGWPSRMISLCVSAPQPACQRTARSRSSWNARASYMSPVVRAR